LGYTYYLEGDYVTAMRYINQSIELDPTNSWAFKNRSLVHIANSAYDKAHEDLKRALALGYREDYDDEVDNLLNKM
jgi:tetratricopeptide (TPR) repeat protein